ncbi:site-specific integrase [Thioalkalivibrio sp. ALJ24]|uniref:site-specific integrase n=1 Tax=Thioalkalivibrio sp. ALJ24 TaxID=545276 RepID=UPI000399DFA1|nr:site-specific integrase [Thioalkalivibrio sp. ALJ24]
MVSDEGTNGTDILRITQDDRCDARLVERFPCILRQPRASSELRSHVAQEWIACAEWLTACTCDEEQAEMITMLRAAGDQMQTVMPHASSLSPVTVKEARRNIRGDTDQVPIYGMLLHVAASDPELRETIRPLAAQLMLAYSTLIYHDEGDRIDLCLSSDQGGKHPIPSAVSATRLVRQLAEGKHKELLAHLPGMMEIFAPEYVDIETHLPDAEAPYASAVRDVGVTIRDARQMRPRRNKRGTTRTPSANASQSPESARFDTNTGRERGETHRNNQRRRNKPVGGTRLLSMSPLSADQVRDHQRAGLAPNEVRAKHATVQSDSLRGEPPGGSLSMRTRCQQGMVKDRARANQGLPIHRGIPRDDEIRFLVEALERWARDLEDTTEIVGAEAVGLLGLMLATGGTLEDLHGLPVVKDESAIPDDQPRAILTRDGVHLWVRVPAPEMDPTLYSEVSDLLQPIDTGLQLTLPSRILTMLRRVRKTAGTLNTSSMFASAPEKLKEAATKRLREINQRHHSQLRLAQIPSVLPQVLADQCGNWSYAWILSGDGDPHAHTPLVYQTSPQSSLVVAYRDAIEHIFGTPNGEAGHLPANSNECYVGSALRPLPGVWEEIARELREGIPEPPSERAGSEVHAIHHDAYTLYTAMLALVGTGLRAVRDPIESVLDIDWDHGLLFVIDKEAKASGNERLIPLAPTVLEQLMAYRRHLLALASRWAYRQPELAVKLRAAAFGNDPSIPFLLFLSTDLSTESVRPGTLSTRLTELFPGPVNVGRHHIRTHLTEAGCPGELIDAILGHEPIGMEAYGPYSALSIHDLRRVALEWIEPMLQQHGWTNVEGVPA